MGGRGDRKSHHLSGACCFFARRSRGSTGSSGCWPSSMPERCSSHSPRAPRPVRRVSASAWGSRSSTAWPSSLGYPVDDDPDPDSPIQLTYEEFAGAVDKLALVGFPMERSAEEAWPQFRGWRINYEASAYRLADAFTAHHSRRGRGRAGTCAPASWSRVVRRIGHRRRSPSLSTPGPRSSIHRTRGTDADLEAVPTPAHMNRDPHQLVRVSIVY
jgi:hypothetical protein